MADAPHDPTAAASPAAPPSSPPPAPPPVVVKKYANRRLYNTETSSYITLDNLADMIRAGRDFVVYDAKSGEDITRGVLTQIIVEEESKGTSMLPTPFLRQLIGFYGDSLQGVVPRYLETAMSSFARQQQQLRQAVQQTISPFLPVGVEEMGRQNLAMIERAMSMFNPFHRGGEPLPPAPAPVAETEAGHAAVPPASDTAELDRLRLEVDALRSQLASAQADAAAHTAAPAVVPEIAEVLPALMADAAPVADAGRHAPPADAAGPEPDHAAAATPALPSTEPNGVPPAQTHVDASVAEAAVHHAVDALAGHAPPRGKPGVTGANMLADPALAAPSRAARRARTPRDTH